MALTGCRQESSFIEKAGGGGIKREEENVIRNEKMSEVSELAGYHLN